MITYSLTSYKSYYIITLVHFWMASVIMLEAGLHDDIIGMDQLNLMHHPIILLYRW